MPALPGGAVLVEQGGEHQLGGVRRQVLDDHRLDVALREATPNLADVLLQAAHHHLVQSTLAPHLDAAGEAVRVQKLQQGREAVRVAVVRRRGQEQAVLEASGQVADCASELGFDPVAPAARGGSVVGLVEDQQAPGQHRSQPLAQRVRVARVDQQVVGDQEAAVGAPRVDPEAALPAHAREIRPIENFEDEAEAIFQLALPRAHLDQLADGGRAFRKLRRRGGVHASVTVVCVFASIVDPSASCIPNRLRAVWQALAWSTPRFP